MDLPDRIPYFEIILVAINFYDTAVFQKIVNCPWFINELTQAAHLFMYDYQLQRLMIGIARLLNMGAFNNNNTNILRMLPDIAARHHSLKNKESGLGLTEKLVDEE